MAQKSNLSFTGGPMVKISFLLRQPLMYGAISAFIYTLIFLLAVFNAYIRDDSEPQLILAFFGFPTSWMFISIFHPFLEWLGPFGTTGRRIGEWSILGVAGLLQYWAIGYCFGYVIKWLSTRDNDSTEE